MTKHTGERAWRRVLQSARPGVVLGLLLALVVVLALHGLLPGMVGETWSSYLAQAHTDCLSESWSLGRPWCARLGIPFGQPLVAEGPVVVLAAGLASLSPLDAGSGYSLARALFLAAALLGAAGLLRRLGASAGVAIVGATAYLVSPTVLGLVGYPGTAEGYPLLPALLLVDLIVAREVERRSGGPLVAVLLSYTAVKTTSLFLDGYSFVVANLGSIAIWAGWAWKARTVSTSRRMLGLAGFLAANGVAVGLYRSYIPDSYEPAPLEVLRALGLDVATLIKPSPDLWMTRALELGGTVSDLWGDGSNARFNYVGVVCLGLAVFGLVRFRRTPGVVPVATAGLVALVLSFGPALKFAEQGPPLKATPTAAYFAPKGTGVEFPWAGLFTAVPGVQDMRATYRWFGLTRAALVILAALGVAALMKVPSRRWVGVALGVLAVVELAPNAPALLVSHRNAANQIDVVRRQVVPELRAGTSRGDRVFFLQPGGRSNEFLSDFLAREAKLSSYNVNGDKNLISASQRWPAEIKALSAPGATADEVVGALSARRAEAVVVPKFSLRPASYSWPPPPQDRARTRAKLAAVLSDSRLSVREGRWVAVVRRRGGR